MWIAQGMNLSMAEGDFGIQLQVQINGATFTESDSIRITFKNVRNGTEILSKGYQPEDGSVYLEFTEAESELFPVGTYVYLIDWYQNGTFLCNLVPAAPFKVVDKA